MTKLAAVFPDRIGGYWGAEAGRSDVDARAIRNGDVGTAGTVRWSALPLRGYTHAEIAKARVRAGDIVLTTSGNCGNVAYIGEEPAEVTVATNFVRILRADAERVDPRYAFHYLRSGWFSRDIIPFVRGATIKNLSVEAAFQAIQIPVPPIGEQRRIAAILDQADAIRTKRRRILALLDTLTQSIYRAMFDGQEGVPECLGNVATLYGGASLPEGEGFSGQSGGTLLMKVSDMNSDGNADSVFATALWTDGQTARSATVPAGAVVLPKRGASIATNKKRVTTRRTALDPNLMGVVPRDGRLTTRYLFEWFKSFDLATITNGSTVPQLNKQDLAPLRIPVPPIERQHDFAARVEAVNAQRATVERALAADDELFRSLQSQAFGGEL